MLGVSFSELFVVCLVAFFVMKPKDISKVIYWYKYILKKILEVRSIAQESLDEINESLGENKSKTSRAKQKYVIDADHKLQETFDSDPLDKKNL